MLASRARSLAISTGQSPPQRANTFDRCPVPSLTGAVMKPAKKIGKLRWH